MTQTTESLQKQIEQYNKKIHHIGIPTKIAVILTVLFIAFDIATISNVATAKEYLTSGTRIAVSMSLLVIDIIIFIVNYLTYRGRESATRAYENIRIESERQALVAQIKENSGKDAVAEALTIMEEAMKKEMET